MTGTSAGRSKHQPPATSDTLEGEQNSSAKPVVSWYQAGKPPPESVGSVGPTRSSAARAGKVTPSISRAADAGKRVSRTRLEFIHCMVGIPPNERETSCINTGYEHDRLLKRQYSAGTDSGCGTV